jgi:hypothetical protein
MNKDKLLSWLERQAIMAINEDIAWTYRKVAADIRKGKFDEYGKKDDLNEQ